MIGYQILKKITSTFCYFPSVILPGKLTVPEGQGSKEFVIFILKCVSYNKTL